MLKAVLLLPLLTPAAGVILGPRQLRDPAPGESLGQEPVGEEAVSSDALRLPPPSVAPLPSALRNGLIFLHMPKTGGSTFGGVMRHIAYRHGLAHSRDHEWLDHENPSDTKKPAVYADHGRRDNVSGKLHTRLPGAFWVTLLRDPVSRCLSSFYHLMVTREGVPATEVNKVRYMNFNCSGHIQTTTVSPRVNMSPERVLASYNFVAVTESFDLSLLLLAKKLGVSQVDMLYLRSKDAGSGRDPLTGKRMAEHPPLSQEPKRVQEEARIRLSSGPDAELLRAANRALAREIAAYGIGFNQDLETFQRRLRMVADRCQAHFWESCLYDDSGCGQDCIESLVKEHHWG